MLVEKKKKNKKKSGPYSISHPFLETSLSQKKLMWQKKHNENKKVEKFSLPLRTIVMLYFFGQKKQMSRSEVSQK
jgi:hypothetical protein